MMQCLKVTIHFKLGVNYLSTLVKAVRVSFSEIGAQLCVSLLALWPLMAY